MIALSQILLLTLIPVVASVPGGVVASFRPPSPRARSFVPHLAVGVVFATAAGELLPEITVGRAPLGVVIGSASGRGVPESELSRSQLRYTLNPYQTSLSSAVTWAR